MGTGHRSRSALHRSMFMNPRGSPQNQTVHDQPCPRHTSWLEVWVNSNETTHFIRLCLFLSVQIWLEVTVQRDDDVNGLISVSTYLQHKFRPDWCWCPPLARLRWQKQTTSPSHRRRRHHQWRSLGQILTVIGAGLVLSDYMGYILKDKEGIFSGLGWRQPTFASTKLRHWPASSGSDRRRVLHRLRLVHTRDRHRPQRARSVARSICEVRIHHFTV